MEFSNFKIKINTSITQLKETFDILYDQLDNINKENPFLLETYSSIKNESLKDMIENLNIHLSMITRDKMKCVFFGKTSNGKSATINAVLGAEVLPSNIGRTTSCFITIEGTDEDDGFLLDKSNNRQHIDDINDLANELSEREQDVNSEIKLFWPKSRCHFLQSEVVLLDSPGVDYSPTNNKWIELYCQDADVFIFVVDACATINESERVFFRRVKRILKTPKIFILMNKWDRCTNNKAMSEIEQLREQHRETSRKFLNEDLKLACDSDKRVFFVSATETLETTLSNIPMDDSDELFEFIRLLQDELSKNAIATKFKPHITTGIEYIESTLLLLEKVLSVRNSASTDAHGREAHLETTISKRIRDTFDVIRKTSTSEIEAQYAMILPSMTKGRDSAEIYEYAFHLSQQLIVKTLEDVFKGSIEKLSLEIKDEFIEYGRFKIGVTSLDHYSLLAFAEYIQIFQRDLPGKVCSTTNELKFACATKKKTEEKDDPAKGIIDLAKNLSLSIVPQMKAKYPTAVAIVDTMTKMADDIDKKEAEKKRTELKKAEGNEIPESFLKSLIVKSLIQFVNETEKGIEDSAIRATRQFLKDAAETNDVLEKLSTTRKTLLDIKMRLGDDLGVL